MSGQHPYQPQPSQRMSTSDKVAAINRYLADHGEYDRAALDASPTDYIADVPKRYRYAWEPNGILPDSWGVCMSYSYAFQVLAMEAGLESVVVTGEMADGGGHAWNKVKLGTGWRAVDPTWNDPEGAWDPTEGTRYLMIRDSQFTGSALRSEDQDWIADAYFSMYATG